MRVQDSCSCLLSLPGHSGTDRHPRGPSLQLKDSGGCRGGEPVQGTWQEGVRPAHTEGPRLHGGLPATGAPLNQLRKPSSWPALLRVGGQPWGGAPNADSLALERQKFPQQSLLPLTFSPPSWRAGQVSLETRVICSRRAFGLSGSGFIDYSPVLLFESQAPVGSPTFLPGRGLSPPGPYDWTDTGPAADTALPGLGDIRQSPRTRKAFDQNSAYCCVVSEVDATQVPSQ